MITDKHYYVFSLLEAINYVKNKNFDGFVAVGGGSVLDTCKAANLYSCDPSAEFLDYVNTPVGKGKNVTVKLKPLVAGTQKASILTLVLLTLVSLL